MKQYVELDFLSNNSSEAEFDWDLFFERFHENLIYETAELRSFEILVDNTDSRGIRHIEYRFGDGFLGIADVVPCKNEIDGLTTDILKHEYERVNSSPLKHLSDVLHSNPDKYVLKFQFRDKQGDTSITNEQQNKAFIVLKSAIKCMKDSFFRVGSDKVAVLEFHIRKTEYRRLTLYKRMLGREKFHLKNSYEDETSDKKYVTYYLW